ncbi:MAG: nucleotidyltransferase family protein [Clostridia bacterium]|nr:nucleotidyltransferase family protein [Clostridia bacterium]
MKDIQRGIIQLVYSGITGEKAEIPDNFDWQQALRAARAHGIEVLLYFGIFHSKIKMPEDLLLELKNRVFLLASQDAKQGYAIRTLMQAFDAKRISYLLLKGAALKNYYPHPEMRHMLDADILIQIEEYDKIKEIMEELGYTFHLESNHEYIWIKDAMQVELHKYLIPSYNKDFFAYFGSGWDFVRKTQDGRCSMKDEDYFIYLFVHLAKHYRDSGIGIKPFVDLWVYRRAKPDLNEAYMEKAMQKLQLFSFYENCMQLLQVWFAKGEENAVTERMTLHIFSAGENGTIENQQLSKALKERNAMQSKKNLHTKLFFKEIFPVYSTMRKKYPILEKVPILLPVFWLIRIASVILFKREEIKNSAEKMHRLTKENIDAYEEQLRFVGLDYNFGENKK